MPGMQGEWCSAGEATHRRKCNVVPCTAPTVTPPARRAIREYPNLSDYVRDLYQTPGLGAAVNISHIKTHYFTSHPKLNVHAIIPKGGDPWWEAPHGRAEKFGAAKKV